MSQLFRVANEQWKGSMKLNRKTKTIEIDGEIMIAKNTDFAEMLTVWDASVRATHHFLTERDVQMIRPFVEKGFGEMDRLLCFREGRKRICGFMGLVGAKIEMLFLDPTVRGNGLGKRLVDYAIHKYSAEMVDVNEQNGAAVGFYRHLGFVETGRSEQDDMGNPFPILHMRLREHY